MCSPQVPVCGRTHTDLFFASTLAFIVAHQFRERGGNRARTASCSCSKTLENANTCAAVTTMTTTAAASTATSSPNGRTMPTERSTTTGAVRSAALLENSSPADAAHRLLHHVAEMVALGAVAASSNSGARCGSRGAVWQRRHRGEHNRSRLAAVVAVAVTVVVGAAMATNII